MADVRDILLQVVRVLPEADKRLVYDKLLEAHTLNATRASDVAGPPGESMQ